MGPDNVRRKIGQRCTGTGQRPCSSDGTPLWHELGRDGGWEEEGPGIRALLLMCVGGGSEPPFWTCL